MGDHKTCGLNYFCVGAVLIFVGSILLCALGFSTIFPYFMTRDWLPSRCLVHDGFYNEHACTCNETPVLYAGCLYRYPCVQVYVTYVTDLTMNDTAVKDVERVTNDDGSGDAMTNETMPQNNEMPQTSNFTTSTAVNESRMSSFEDVVKSAADINSARSSRFVRRQDREMDDSRRHRDWLYGVRKKTPSRGALTDTSKYALLYRSWADVFYNTVSRVGNIDIQGVLKVLCFMPC